MSGTQLRTMGTTAQFAPIIKRGIATFSDGRSVALSIDTNLAGSGGTDVTGVAKIHLYVSTTTTRLAWTLAASLTPAAAPASSTRYAVASMSVAADNSVWVAWQGVDNGLYVSKWTYSAGALTFSATETVQASGAVTNRFRAVDIDVAGNANVGVAAYEANASTGNASFLRLYVRNNSATWVRAINFTGLATGQFIRDGSEDIAFSWRGDGIVSNVGNYVFYGTKTSTTADFGDTIGEYSFNVSTGTTDSSTVITTWSTTWNQNQAAGTRRAMYFIVSPTVWVLCGVIGAGVPKFWATKLLTGSHPPPAIINTAGYVSSVALSNYFQIDASANARTYWSASYTDNRLLFGFAGVGTGSAPRIFREVAMTWSNGPSVNAKSTIDLVPRPMDSAYYGFGGPIAVYGGDNKQTAAGLNHYNFVTMYGPPANTLSTTNLRQLRFVSEDTFDAPDSVAPSSVEPTDRPTYRVRVENVNLQPNLYGKIEVNVAADTLFSVSLKDIVEPDANLRYFGSQDGLSGGVTQVAVPTPGASTALVQGTWYWRSRVVSDKGSIGAWSTTVPFSVSHPPTANPISPGVAAVVAYLASNLYSFSWQRSDTEPTDVQTSYRLIVVRRDTGASIVDTGFVASASTSATVSIDPVALGVLEAPLSWTVQLKDSDGVSGPVSTSTPFTIGSPPALTLLAPLSGVPVSTALPTVTWSFTGSGSRVQNAYRVSIYDNQTPNLVVTNPSFESGSLTGWTAGDGSAAASSTQSHSGTYSAFVTPNGTGGTPRVMSNAVAVTAGVSYTVEAWVRPTTVNKQSVVGIQWSDTTWSTLGLLNSIAGVWQKVSITVVAPPGVTTGAAFAGVGGTPATGDTAYVDDVSLHLAGTLTNDPVVTTGWLVGTANSYTFTSQVLVNSSPYLITVEVQDSGGLKSIDSSAVITAWTPPALAGGAAVTVPDEFKVHVAWTNASQDTDWVAYRVYRRFMIPSISDFDVNNTATTWYLMYETSDVQSSYTFDDYLAPLNKAADYVVVQVADRFGSLIESTISTVQTVTLASQRYFFVPDVNIGTIASFEAMGVTGDNFSREVEQETLHVVGRGRQVQIGDDLGVTGTLTIKLRNPATARRDREFFELVSSTFNRVYIKSPFGDVVLIALGNVASDRQAGYGGYADFADITVPYMQIIDESFLARLG